MSKYLPKSNFCGWGGHPWTQKAKRQERTRPQPPEHATERLLRSEPKTGVRLFVAFCLTQFIPWQEVLCWMFSAVGRGCCDQHLWRYPWPIPWPGQDLPAEGCPILNQPLPLQRRHRRQGPQVSRVHLHPLHLQTHLSQIHFHQQVTFHKWMHCSAPW